VNDRHSRQSLRLDAFFADLGRQRRSWDGTKEWDSLGLHLAASHDGLGHVTLEAILDADYAAPR